MGLKLSTGLRNALLGQRGSGVAFQGITGTLVDGSTSSDTITRSSGSWLTDGWTPGMVLVLKGAHTSANDTAVSGVVITNVTADTLTIPTGTVNTAEAFDAGTTLVGIKGSSFADIMANGIARIYTGTQPADADAGETGTLLLTITANSGAFTAGVPTNGLLFAALASDGEITKLSTQVWSGVAVASGTAGYIRFYANDVTAGASTTSIRFDCNISTTSYPVKMPSTSIVSGATTTIDSFKMILPAS